VWHLDLSAKLQLLACRVCTVDVTVLVSTLISKSIPHLLLLVKARLLPVLPVTLGQPPARLKELNNVHVLLESHDGQADDAERPWDLAVHLVGAGHFHCGGRERRGEESGGLGRGGRAGEEGERFAAVDWKEGGGDCWRGETEKIESDEEELVEGAADEKDPLV
jgi:hypothetical protein